MNVGSLFSGIGGIEIGFECEGFRTEWFVEYDPYAQAVLRKRWPEATIYGDITKIDFSTVPKVDILTGGFPCQDISNAGKRVGISGSRSSLWKYYLEAIRVLRPKYAVIENVSALINRGLNVVLADLAQVGYDAEWYNISASAVGAPHRRERLFIIAYSNSSRCDNGFNNQQERYLLHDERTSKKSKQEWNGRECGTWQISSDVSDTNRCSNGEYSEDLGCETRETGNEGKETFSQRPVVGICSEMADSDSCRHVHRESEIITAEGGEYAQREPKSSSEDVPNLYEQSMEGSECEQEQRIFGGSCRKERAERDGWWATEPELGRVAHGIPNRVDRIKCLGNAVVPQVAQVIAQAIKEQEGGKGG